LKFKILKTISPENILSFRELFFKHKEDLSERLKYVTKSLDVESKTDLVTHIIGMGKPTYDAVIEMPRIAIDIKTKNKIPECFEYCIPSESDVELLSPEFYKNKAQNYLTRELNNPPAPTIPEPYKTDIISNYESVIEKLRMIIQGNFNIVVLDIAPITQVIRKLNASKYFNLKTKFGIPNLLNNIKYYTEIYNHE
jgi:hypothetical protein